MLHQQKHSKFWQFSKCSQICPCHWWTKTADGSQQESKLHDLWRTEEISSQIRKGFWNYVFQNFLKSSSTYLNTKSTAESEIFLKVYYRTDLTTARTTGWLKDLIYRSVFWLKVSCDPYAPRGGGTRGSFVIRPAMAWRYSLSLAHWERLGHPKLTSGYRKQGIAPLHVLPRPIHVNKIYHLQFAKWLPKKH